MRVDHLSFLVKNLPEAIDRFSLIFGEVKHKESILEQKVDVALFELENVKIELICPHKDNRKLMERLANQGEGFHHFAIAGDGVEEKIVHVQDHGIRLTDEKRGANQTKVQFIHPKTMVGNLIEIVK